MSKESITRLLGSPIAYYSDFAKATGDVCAGVFVSQMFYWHGKGKSSDGWIYKTQKEIQEETGLSRRNQETARRRLKKLGVLEEVKRGIPAKLYFRLDTDLLFSLLDEYHEGESSKDGGTVQTEESEPCIVNGGTVQTEESSPANLYTENTTKNTTESTATPTPPISPNGSNSNSTPIVAHNDGVGQKPDRRMQQGESVSYRQDQRIAAENMRKAKAMGFNPQTYNSFVNAILKLYGWEIAVDAGTERGDSYLGKVQKAVINMAAYGVTDIHGVRDIIDRIGPDDWRMENGLPSGMGHLADMVAEVASGRVNREQSKPARPQPSYNRLQEL